MFRGLFLTTTGFLLAQSAILDCGSQWSIRSMIADPPATVGVGQSVSLNMTFSIPETWPQIHDGFYTVSGSLGHTADIEITESLCKYLTCPLLPNTYMWSWVSRFPEDIVGRVNTQITITGTAAEQRPWICLSWVAFATGHPSNKTNTVMEWLFS